MTVDGKHACSALDLISAIMDTPERPLDAVVIARLCAEIPIERLETGAASARHVYPQSASRLVDRHWHFSPQLATAIQRVTNVETFLDAGVDLQNELPMRQALLERQDGLHLVTYFHHAAADLVSVAMWLEHQLDVATGRREAVTAAHPYLPVALKDHPRPVRKSQYAHAGPSTALWRRHDQPGRARKVRVIDLDARTLMSLVGDGFTYNDLLAAVTLEVFHRWNTTHGAKTDRLALWCPVNIRKSPFDGFGNGSSRLRVYPQLLPDTPLVDRCREIRTQVQWSKSHGEWWVPAESPLMKLPDPWMSRVVKTYLNRPWVDMASGMLSHAQRLTADDNGLPEVDRIEVIGEMHRHYPFGPVAITHREVTTYAIDYDPAMLREDDMDELEALFRDRFEHAQRALS